MNPRTKGCSKCHQQKPLNAFYRSSTGKLGRLSWCKVCHGSWCKDNRKARKARGPVSPHPTPERKEGDWTGTSTELVEELVATVRMLRTAGDVLKEIVNRLQPKRHMQPFAVAQKGES